MEGEFTAAVLTMVAKSSSPEMAARLAHGEKEVLIPLLSLQAIHGSGDVCLTFFIGSQCAESLTGGSASMAASASYAATLYTVVVQDCQSLTFPAAHCGQVSSPTQDHCLLVVTLIAAPICRRLTPS